MFSLYGQSVITVPAISSYISSHMWRSYSASWYWVFSKTLFHQSVKLKALSYIISIKFRIFILHMNSDLQKLHPWSKMLVSEDCQHPEILMSGLQDKLTCCL